MQLSNKIKLLLFGWKLTSHKTQHKMKFREKFISQNVLLLPWQLLRLELVSSSFLNDLISWQNTNFLLNYSLCLATLVSVALFFRFPSLCTILIAVACGQLLKVKAALLDIRQQHITSHHVQEDEQVHATANINLQEKLNTCIRHHQEIME